MKVLGTILIAAGVIMLIFRNISFTKQEKIVDMGPVEINKKEKKTVDWPNYAGAVVLLAGAGALYASRNKS